MSKLIFALSTLLTLQFPFCASADDWRERGLLFHAGFRPFLEGDIEANGISEDVWKSAIFGTTNFDLPEYRKGLYGAMNWSGTSLYSLYQFIGGREPWVMVIKVKKSCMENESMFNSDYANSLRRRG